MFRSHPLAVAVLCTAALAACSDSTTTGVDRGKDALVNATNQNLAAEIVFEATQSETVTPGVALQPLAYCDGYEPIYQPVYSATPSSGDGETVTALRCYDDPYYPPEDPYYPPPPPPPPPAAPVFDVPVPSISGSSYAGTKTVNLNASGNFSYASFGQLTAIFQNIGGCPTYSPSEYSRSTVSAQNAPFTLGASRSASYNGTSSIIKWGVHVTSYAESPEGGSGTKINSSTFCY